MKGLAELCLCPIWSETFPSLWSWSELLFVLISLCLGSGLDWFLKGERLHSFLPWHKDEHARSCLKDCVFSMGSVSRQSNTGAANRCFVNWVVRLRCLVFAVLTGSVSMFYLTTQGTVCVLCVVCVFTEEDTVCNTNFCFQFSTIKGISLLTADTKATNRMLSWPLWADSFLDEETSKCVKNVHHSPLHLSAVPSSCSSCPTISSEIFSFLSQSKSWCLRS